MTKSKRPLGPLYGLKYPPKMPASLQTLALRLKPTELDTVRAAMAVWAASRQPQMTWEGWKVVGIALEIAERRAKEAAKGNITSRGTYGQAIDDFLKKTGFTFINKGVRWSLRECMERVDDIEEWRDSLLASDRNRLHNPIDIWKRFNEDQRQPRNDPKLPRPKRAKREDRPTLLDEFLALQDAYESVEANLANLQEALSELGAHITVKSAEKMPDDLLRKVFALLPDDVQDALHDRLEQLQDKAE